MFIHVWVVFGGVQYILSHQLCVSNFSMPEFLVLRINPFSRRSFPWLFRFQDAPLPVRPDPPCHVCIHHQWSSSHWTERNTSPGRNSDPLNNMLFRFGFAMAVVAFVIFFQHFCVFVNDDMFSQPAFSSIFKSQKYWQMKLQLGIPYTKHVMKILVVCLLLGKGDRGRPKAYV